MGQYDAITKKYTTRNETTETGYSKTICASLRLSSNGSLAEISGLDDGQALEDSLVSITEQKASQYPGFHNFLKKFEDKKKLIVLWQKMKRRPNSRGAKFPL